MNAKKVGLVCLWILALGASNAYQYLTKTPPPANRRFVQAPGYGAIAYTDYGNGPTVLLLHGSPGSADDLDAVARALAQTYRTLTPDLLCAGYSAHPPDCGAAAQARAMLALLDATGADRTFVFAHSYGGAVAIELARSAPERVRALVSYGGIGIQEGEGSGDYYIEQIKYAAGMALAAWGAEALPHFGFIGAHQTRRGFLQQFQDLDQRPLRAALATLSAPALFLHGSEDPLVPVWVAEEHHRITPQSELIVWKTSHFDIFSDAGAQRLARTAAEFYERRADAPEAAVRAPVRESAAHLARPRLPFELNLDPSLSAWAKLLAIVSGTFISEDLTCISVGLLIRAHRLDVFTGLFACFIGIFLGDLGLYLLGRLVALGLFTSPRVRALLPGKKLAPLRARFDREGWRLIFLSRFLPGTRFPVYVGAGLIGGHASRLAVFALLAGLIWTPLLVLLSAALGPALLAPFHWLVGEGWLALAAAALAVYGLLRLLARLLTARGREGLRLSFARARRLEFWSPWLFYAPLLPLWIWLHIRYRGFKTITASNPGIALGGLIGESKSEILAILPPRWTLPYFLNRRGPDAAERSAAALARMQALGLNFPIILKPDLAEKGFGLKLARSADDVRAYFAAEPDDVIFQAYHPGPHEAGVFYYRFPDEPHGRILALTHKIFPEVTGDGRTPLGELIRRHPRYRLQQDVFFTRHADRLAEVLGKGERIQLALAGNHYQGTLFKDGAALITPALSARIDDIARAIPGFYFGRFDLRYSDLARFQAGEDLAIVELNGATSEATVIYDPDWSALAVYRMLWRQWRLAFEIGAANRKRGAPATGYRRIFQEIRRHRARNFASKISD